MIAAALHDPSLPTDDTPVPRAAEMYAELGFRVVPLWGLTPSGACMCGNPDCQPRSYGKHPVHSRWQAKATRDVDDARELFRSHRGNIGIMLGTDLVVIDVDGEEGFASLAALGPLPPTLTSISGSGVGQHLVYAYAKHHDPAKITNRRVLPGLDVKTRNGQMVVAPSMHRAGNRYKWTTRMMPVPLPDALYDQICKAPATVVSMPRPAQTASAQTASDLSARARAYVDKIPPAVSGNGGHDQTFAAARAIVGWMRRGLPEHEALALLSEYNARCDPPWSERELVHKWRQALEATTVPAITDRPVASGQHAPVRNILDDGADVVSVIDPPITGGGPPAPPASTDWRALMLWEATKNGNRPAKHLENAVVILRYHPQWTGRVRLNRHAGLVTVTDPPWHVSDRSDTAAEEWTDEDSARLSAWIKREVNLDMSIDNCDRAVTIAAEANSFHPVRDYFDGLVWDQSPRLATAAATYLGAEQTQYVACVFRWWMTAAVARTYRPGEKVDNVLILEGNQDLKKSYALKVLASQKWFTDTPIDLQSKDAFLAMKGKLVIELAELESLRKADANRAKTFFTSPVDMYRPPYGKRTVEIPRSCVFAGTVNPNSPYLQDPTGNRRYWPIRCSRVDLDGLKRDRDQLWAEAVHWFRAGAFWWAETPEEKAMCAAEVAPRAESDEWESRIESHLASRVQPTPSVGEILVDVLDIHRRDWTRADQMRVAGILQRLGFEKFRESSPPRTWRYRVRTKVTI